MAWRARARSRSCASAVGRRWIKGAVNERAPEDCGALRYYKRSLVKQMRREGKGWWVLKKLGGEIEVSNPRKRVKLAPAAASLVTFSFALLLSSSLLYAALRRRRALRQPKKMSFTRFSLIDSINACSFLVACASLRDICNTMPTWAISGMPRNGIPTCLFTTTRLTP